MIDKKDENSKARKCCSNKLHIIIVVLAALLIVSGYFNWKYYKFYRENNLYLNLAEENRKMAEKFVSGKIINISPDTIEIETNLARETQKITINNETKIRGMQTTFNRVSAEEMEKLQNQELAINDLKIGDSVNVLLTGTIKDKELTAQEITVIK